MTTTSAARATSNPVGERREPGWLRAVTALTLIVAIAAVTVVVGVSAWSKVLNGGAQVAAVTSNSMQPAFSAKDLLAVAPVKDPASLNVDQIVTMKRPTGTIVTHRIIKVETKGGVTSLTTKGDANNAPDPDVATGDQVIGTVVARIPALAPLLEWLQSPAGRLLTVGPFFLLIIAKFLVKMWRPIEEPEEMEPAPAGEDQQASVTAPA